MKAVDIVWDVDNEEDLADLPTEIEIPEGMTDEDEISDYISDFTGFCHYGFVLEEEMESEICYDENSCIVQSLEDAKKKAKELGAELHAPEDAFFDDNHLDCVWYGGWIATLSYKGHDLLVKVYGDVSIYGEIDGEEFHYRNKSGEGAMYAADSSLRDLFDSDEALNAAYRAGNIQYDNNNWIEAFIVTKDGYEMDGIIDEGCDVLESVCDVEGWIKVIEQHIAEKEKKPALEQQIDSAASKDAAQTDDEVRGQRAQANKLEL